MGVSRHSVSQKVLHLTLNHSVSCGPRAKSVLSDIRGRLTSEVCGTTIGCNLRSKTWPLFTFQEFCLFLCRHPQIAK